MSTPGEAEPLKLALSPTMLNVLDMHTTLTVQFELTVKTVRARVHTLACIRKAYTQTRTRTYRET